MSIYGFAAAAFAFASAVPSLLEQAYIVKAASFCEARYPGESLETIAAEAMDLGFRDLRKIEPDRVQIGYLGTGLFGRHLCIVEGSNGAVLRAYYFYEL